MRASREIMCDMIRVANIHGVKSGAYKKLKSEWFISVDCEYSRLRNNTTQAQREKLLDRGYKQTIRNLKALG